MAKLLVVKCLRSTTFIPLSENRSQFVQRVSIEKSTTALVSELLVEGWLNGVSYFRQRTAENKGEIDILKASGYELVAESNRGSTLPALAVCHFFERAHRFDGIRLIDSM